MEPYKRKFDFKVVSKGLFVNCLDAWFECKGQKKIVLLIATNGDCTQFPNFSNGEDKLSALKESDIPELENCELMTCYVYIPMYMNMTYINKIIEERAEERISQLMKEYKQT
jgi:hypothetical protein